MVHSLLKSLLLYSTLAASFILAAPAQHHQHVDRSSVVTGGVSRRGDLPLPHSWADGSTASTPVEKRSGGVKKPTNAMRIANGLPPLTPRKLYDGSKSGSAHRARASPSSVSAILVYDSNGLSGSRLGYVSKGFNVPGNYALTTDCTAAMLNPQLLSGALTNPASPSGYSKVGFASLINSAFSTSSSGYAFMGGTASTSTGSVPLPIAQHSNHLGNRLQFIESNVWSLEANNELIPTWVNPDGNPAHTEIGYAPALDNSIVISGSISKSSAALGTTVLTRFFLTDQFTCGN